jgi:hypothetical protein
MSRDAWFVIRDSCFVSCGLEKGKAGSIWVAWLQALVTCD